MAAPDFVGARVRHRLRAERAGWASGRAPRDAGWTGIVESHTDRTALCRHAPEPCDCEPRDSSCYRCDGSGTAVRRRYALVDLADERRPLISALVLRRRMGRAPTFGDLRLAYAAALAAALDHPLRRYMTLRRSVRGCWPSAIRKRLRGYDEIVAIVAEGRSRPVLRLHSEGEGNRIYLGTMSSAIFDLLAHADDMGYWHRPRALRHDLKHPLPMQLVMSIPRSLRRAGPLKRHSPLRRWNRERAAKRFEVAFGERGALVRKLPCLVGQGCYGCIEAAHARSRGAGGTRRDLVPLCFAHHSEQHRIGRQSFELKHGLNLADTARQIAADLDARGVP